MKEQAVVQQLLRKKFSESKSRNPGYSLRSFSKRVGVHVGALSHILSGKRNVSRELAERITTRLALDPQQRSEVLSLFPQKRKRATGSERIEIESRYLELSATQYKVAAEWEHFAVMSLLRCKDVRSEISWIAQRLGIPETRAQQVVSRLLELGLIELTHDGTLKRTQEGFRTLDDVADSALKQHHDQSLDLARESLYRDSIQARDMTSVTMAIDPKKIGTAKELIRKFEDDLSDLLESGHQTEVYRLSVQLFPLSQIREGEQK